MGVAAFQIVSPVRGTAGLHSLSSTLHRVDLHDESRPGITRTSILRLP